MEEVPCLHCGSFYIPRNRKQSYCTFPDCQRARKAAWQRKKLQTDPAYREDQRISNKKWQKSRPDYWKEYRCKNPDKAERNRLMQRIRNRRNKGLVCPDVNMIAKMDVRKTSVQELCGQYWLVPAIAKMDVAKIYLHAISTGCQ